MYAIKLKARLILKPKCYHWLAQMKIVKKYIPFGYKKFIVIRFGLDPRIVKQTNAKGNVKNVEKVVISSQHDDYHQ